MRDRKSAFWAGIAILAILASGGCGRDTGGLGIAPLDTDPVVFRDQFGDGVIFQAFLDTKYDAVNLDTVQRHQGTASLKITVPGPGDDTGLYAGGAFTASMVRNLSVYNALTFWAKASRDISLNVAGLGNDNTGESRFDASRSDVPVTTEWTQFVIPIPLPEKLASEAGLFYFAEGEEDGEGFDLWFDEVTFDRLDTISDPRPTLLPTTEVAFVGQTLTMQGTRTTFDVDGTDQTVEHQPGYFTFASSADSVARVDGEEIRIVGPGTATITAKLGDVDAGGAVTLDATAPPMSAAPTPTHPAADVVSLFSNAYENRTVDTWSTPWDNAGFFDLQIAGDDVKVYTNLVFAGIEFATETVDASEMTHFHIDVWGPDGFFVKLKLVDFGEDGEFGGGDDSPSQFDQPVGVLIDTDLGEWTSLDIPLSDFEDKGLANRAHLAQLIIEGGAGAPDILYVDNIYFHK